jgi:hypothetical protein
MTEITRAASLIGVFLLIIARPAAAEPPCLRIGIDPGSLGAKATANVVKALYDQAGLCVTIQEIPNRRIAIMIRAHELDGEGARIGDYIAGSPDLLPIPTPLIAVTGKLYWLKGRGRPEGSGHTIGFIRGYIWPPLVARTLDLGTTEVADQKSLAKMAASGRLDGFFMTDREFARLQSIDREKFESAPVRDLTIFHSVTRDHAALVPRLDVALRKLKADGTLEQLLYGPTSKEAHN